jgi:glucose 1-dehydrogenase
MQFQGKSVIVTGAGQGIGLEICRKLATAGAYVLLNDIDPSLAVSAVTEINRSIDREQCRVFAGDASDHQFINAMVSEAVTQFGKLDIVVANAGITLFGDFFQYSPEAFNRVLQVNLSGSFFLTQAAANQMRKQESGGSILLMSSVTGHQAHKNLAAYGMTKAALEMLAKNLVVELSPFKININTIAPGATLTERTEADAGYLDTWSKLTPLGTPATVGDIAAAALFLLSPEAKHITGQSLVVDGGWTSVSPQPE